MMCLFSNERITMICLVVKIPACGRQTELPYQYHAFYS